MDFLADIILFVVQGNVVNGMYEMLLEVGILIQDLEAGEAGSLISRCVTS